MKKLIAGNWKMNGTSDKVESLVSSINATLKNDDTGIIELCDILICPPSLYISKAQILCDNKLISIGAQDCSTQESGAYTGEISAPMLSDYNIEYAIAGHSERRQYHNETNDIVSQKANQVHKAGLKAIICIGETEEERATGKEKEVIAQQLRESLPETANAQNTIIAYEPVWAIGTGKTASVENVASMHSFIREKLKEQLAQSENIRILYGGSMKPENAKELLSTQNVDGGLIGGASLNAEQFIAIARAAL